MTEHSLKAIALQNGGYEAPELNDTLYLHFKGERIFICFCRDVFK